MEMRFKGLLGLILISVFLVVISVFVIERFWNNTEGWGTLGETRNNNNREEEGYKGQFLRFRDEFHDFTKDLKETLEKLRKAISTTKPKEEAEEKKKEEEEEEEEARMSAIESELHEIKQLLIELREGGQQVDTEQAEEIEEPIRGEEWSRERVLEDLLMDKHELLPFEERQKIGKEFCSKLKLTRTQGVCSDYHYNPQDQLSRQVLEELVEIQFPDDCKEVVGWWHLFSINEFGLGARLYHFARNGAVAFSEKKMLIEMKEEERPHCSLDRPLQCWFQPQTDCLGAKEVELHDIIQDIPEDVRLDTPFKFHDSWSNYMPDRIKETGMGWQHFRTTLMRYHFRPSDRILTRIEEAKRELNWPVHEPVISMHVRHGDKGDNGLELALLGLVIPLSEYRQLRRSKNLGLVPFSSYMEMAERVKELNRGVRTIYLETDDAEVWGNVTEYPEWRFLRWQPEGDFQGLDNTFTAMALLGQGDFWIGTFSSSFGRLGYDLGILFGRVKAGISLDIKWMTI